MTSSVADALVGVVVDRRYRILSHLADGGMASVYVAMDARLDRRVALKVMRPALATDDTFVERFRSEARSAARLSHPNVVAVFDQGDDDGTVFLAMEFVDGKTLREVIDEEAPLTARESIAIIEPILEALRAAHVAGIVHRDVKPENVIIRRDGEVKVADFGLARAITEHTATNQSGLLLGTASYLSPEQVEHGRSDARSDVYAAGLMLFEMLTGRKAVTGDTAIQIAFAHVHGTIPVPSSLVANLAPTIDALVARATATDPDARFASAGEFLAEVRRARRELSAAQLDHRQTAPPSASPAGAEGRPATAATAALPIFNGSAARGDETQPQPRPTTSAAAAARAREIQHTRAIDVGERHPVSAPSTAAKTAEKATKKATKRTTRKTDKTAGRRRGWRLPVVVALVVLLLGGAGTAGWWFLAGPGATTVVTDVIHHQTDSAVTELQRADLTPFVQEVFSENEPKGQVISSDPAKGLEVRKGTEVTLVVSKGPERYAVPALTGTTASSVPAALKPLTLTIGKQTEAYSETVAKGVVISQEPAAGASVKRATTVNLVVSKGRQPIAVPTVTGLSVDAAKKKITDAKLAVVEGDRVNSDTVEAGRVVSQTPAKGTLFRDGKVTIVVSKGPVMVTVPRMVGENKARAEQLARDAGLKPVFEYPFGGSLFDQVRVQSLASGSSVPKGSTVTLTIV